MNANPTGICSIKSTLFKSPVPVFFAHQQPGPFVQLQGVNSPSVRVKIGTPDLKVLENKVSYYTFLPEILGHLEENCPNATTCILVVRSVVSDVVMKCG